VRLRRVTEGWKVRFMANPKELGVVARLRDFRLDRPGTINRHTRTHITQSIEKPIISTNFWRAVNYL
jgi:hypothetical protein